MYSSMAFLSFFFRIKDVSVIHLVLHDAEEVLHQGVVHAVAFPGEGLEYAFVLKPGLIWLHLVLPALVGMEDQPVI